MSVAARSWPVFPGWIEWDRVSEVSLNQVSASLETIPREALRSLNRNRLAEFRCRSNTRSYRYWRIVRGCHFGVALSKRQRGEFNLFLRFAQFSRNRLLTLMVLTLLQLITKTCYRAARVSMADKNDDYLFLLQN